MAPIRLGIIGLSTSPNSWAANSLVPPLLRLPLSDHYTITAICTASETSAKASTTKYSEIVGHPIQAYYGDSGPSDIAHDENVDLVVVAVKSPSHKKVVMQVIEAGMDFFIEWPAGMNLEETKEIAEAAQRKGVLSIIGAQSYGSPAINKVGGGCNWVIAESNALITQVREIISSGRLGRIISSSVMAIKPEELPAFSPKVIDFMDYSTDPSQGNIIPISRCHRK